MKLMRIGEVGHERPAVRIDENFFVDVSDHFGDFDEAFFESDLLPSLTAIVEERATQQLVQPFVSSTGERLRIGPPLARPHQILCIGLNYSDHAMESGMPVPAEPVVFSKSPNTLVGPYDPVIMPRNASKLDWEVELGIVVGKRCRYLESAEHARDHVAGFVLVNDVSERSFQLEHGGQWTKGKSAESFNPAGPWLATLEEFSDPLSLDMWLDVNGNRKQTGDSSNMIFDPFSIVHYLSQYLVLEPGDLINTGTPAGVGLGSTPPAYLAVGDEIALGIEGLGVQRQRVVPSR